MQKVIPVITFSPSTSNPKIIYRAVLGPMFKFQIEMFSDMMRLKSKL
jgi:hypothetical protein